MSGWKRSLTVSAPASDEPLSGSTAGSTSVSVCASAPLPSVTVRGRVFCCWKYEA